MFAATIWRKRVDQLRALSTWRRHVDEGFEKINGERHYLWRPVHHEGKVLEAVVTERRSRQAALRFLRKAMWRYGRREEVVTDRLATYRAALKDVGASKLQTTGQ